VDGEFQLVFGTSASAPVVASMITLINDARIAAGKGPVGFLNPTVRFCSLISQVDDY
jgi:tripeptidyl-peptidase I